MKELFGIPMSTFATILVVLLVICLLIVVYIALRKPIVNSNCIHFPRLFCVNIAKNYSGPRTPQYHRP